MFGCSYLWAIVYMVAMIMKKYSSDLQNWNLIIRKRLVFVLKMPFWVVLVGGSHLCREHSQRILSLAVDFSKKFFFFFFIATEIIFIWWWKVGYAVNHAPQFCPYISYILSVKLKPKVNLWIQNLQYSI